MMKLRRSHLIATLIATLLVVAVAVAACGGDAEPATSPTQPSEAPNPAEDPAGEEPGGEEPASEEPGGDEPASDEPGREEPLAHPIPDPPFEDVETATFTNPTQIDNEWLGMQPGTQRIYGGSVTEDGEKLPHSIEFTVTDLVKEVDGVRTVVALIRDISDGELVEAEIAFYAQASDGTVWFFGEYPEVYEDGEFVEADGWLPGQQDARAGIAMEADPREGAADYAQGWAPENEWTDRAQVLLEGQTTCVAAGCYDDVLIMDEWSADEPGFILKSYARGVGNVQVGFRGDVASEESLELVEVKQLEPEALAAVRAEALALDERAYSEAAEIWSATEPAERS